MADAATPAADTRQPCWYVVPDPVKCETYPTQLSIATYPPDRVTPSETHLTAQCITKK
jgi:hypothetical protein